MKYKSIFIFTLFNIILCNVQAQNISVGFRGGLTIPNLSAESKNNKNPLDKGYSSRQGVGFGVFTEFKISNLFSIQPMLEYSQQGAKKNGLQAFGIDEETTEEVSEITGQAADPYLYANYKSSVKLNYLMLPILEKFTWRFGKQNQWQVYGDAGPFAGLLLNAHQIQRGTSTIYFDAAGQQPIPAVYFGGEGNLTSNFDTTVNIKDSLHTFNFGIEANIGIAYNFGRNKIFIEGGGNYGLLNIQKGTANGKNNTGALTLMIGYSYGF